MAGVTAPSTCTPRKGRTTWPVAAALCIAGLASLMATAKLIPWAWPAPAVLIPITSALALSRGPRSCPG